MHGPPLFAVDFNFAITRLEQERDNKRTQRKWTNIVVLVAAALFMWFSALNLSYDHSVMTLLNLAIFGFLMDRINRLHIKYIGDQINLLICIENRGGQTLASTPQ